MIKEVGRERFTSFRRFEPRIKRLILAVLHCCPSIKGNHQQLAVDNEDSEYQRLGPVLVTPDFCALIPKSWFGVYLKQGSF